MEAGMRLGHCPNVTLGFEVSQSSASAHTTQLENTLKKKKDKLISDSKMSKKDRHAGGQKFISTYTIGTY